MENSKIAIIGMSGRFPDADSVESLFQNCLDGIVSIRKFSDDELINSGLKRENLKDENYIKWGSFVKDIDKFDNTFFKMTNVEASIADPQQRIFLKCAWEALENANYSPYKFNGNIGVFASSSLSTYLINNVLKSKYYKDKDFDYASFINNDKDFLPTKVSYKFGLNGPSIAIQSGCSSSLVAAHYACKSILDRECDMAIVGGVSISVPQKVGYHYKEGSNFSKDGQIRPFDSGATGMVKGNGCGVVVLKELNNSIKDHDCIYAVIDSSEVNNDGKNKVGYTAPSVNGQTNVIKSSINKSKIDINKIKYIETHGTGTKIGDPIEIRALTRAYKDIDKDHKVVIGSIKANIGHLDSASGIVGLIKTAMILNKGIIPKSVNFKSPNPQINFDEIPFCLETERNIKLNSSEKNYAAVSSFGIGGTNVHMILENYEKRKGKENNTKSYILPFSAKSESALNILKNNMKEFLETNYNLNICDLAFSLCFGRTDFKYRHYIIASSIKEVIKKLSSSEIYSSNNLELDKIAQQWKEGKNISWNFLFKEQKVFRIPLPTYPFEEKSFWMEPLIHKDKTKKLAEQDQDQDIEYINKLTEVEIVKQVEDVWSDDLQMDIQENSDFFDIGGESLIAIDIISDLNKKFDLQLPTNIVSELPTPKLIGSYIYKLKNKYELDEFENVIKIVSNDSSNKNLFLIHPAGGSTYCYNILSKYLAKYINIYAISFPQNIKVDIEIKELAKIYAREIIKIQPEGSLYIGGYSFGGNVAIEIASQLKDYKRNVKKIFMIDSIVPEAYSKDGINKNKCIKKFPFVWSILTGNLEKAQSLMKFDNNKDINMVIEDMKRDGSISNKLSNTQIERTFNTWISNHRALSLQNKYIKVDIPIVIFFAKEKMPKFMYEFANMKLTDCKSWSKYTSKGIKIFGIEGNHFSIITNKKNIKILADNINRELKNI